MMRKDIIIAVRVDNYIARLLNELKYEFGSVAEAVRRAILTIRVLYDEKLTLDKAFRQEVLKRITSDKEAVKYITLGDALKPIPKLAEELRLDPIKRRLIKGD